MQYIKNELVGEENEGFELYPRESRLVDTANQFHIWVFQEEKNGIPIGWEERVVPPPIMARVHGKRLQVMQERPSRRPLSPCVQRRSGSWLRWEWASRLRLWHPSETSRRHWV